jgi:hypothetical protein
MKYIKLIGLLTIFFSSSAFSKETDITTTDLIITQTWLNKIPDSNWKLLYNKIGDKKYRWIITKLIKDDEIVISFRCGVEIDESGKVIGPSSKVSDQFFDIVIDKKTYKYKSTLLGG